MNSQGTRHHLSPRQSWCNREDNPAADRGSSPALDEHTRELKQVRAVNAEYAAGIERAMAPSERPTLKAHTASPTASRPLAHVGRCGVECWPHHHVGTVADFVGMTQPGCPRPPETGLAMPPARHPILYRRVINRPVRDVLRTHPAPVFQPEFPTCSTQRTPPGTAYGNPCPDRAAPLAIVSRGLPPPRQSPASSTSPSRPRGAGTRSPRNCAPPASRSGRHRCRRAGTPSLPP